MIGRLWRGWATVKHAPEYEELFRTDILPELQRIDGFIGAYVMRKDAGEEIELVTITLFASMEAIRVFAGPEPELAHVTPEARQLLSHFETTVSHYDVVVTA